MTATAVVSRRLDGGSGSSRSLLLTVLGELVLPHGGAAWTASLVQVLNQFGVEEKATRQAVMRTAGAGWLSPEKVGRRTRWHLTDSAVQLLRTGAQRIYTFGDSATTAWDGQWLLVAAKVPEVDRRARHLLRSRLSWAGLSSMAPGIWIGARTDRLPEVEAVLAAAGARGSQCFLATHTNGDAVAMVAQTWKLEETATAYRSFSGTFGTLVTDDPMTAQVDLVHRWRRFPQIDPCIPRPLLPADWPGEEAADIFRARHEEWRAAAGGRWLELEQEQG